MALRLKKDKSIFRRIAKKNANEIEMGEIGILFNYINILIDILSIVGYTNKVGAFE